MEKNNVYKSIEKIAEPLWLADKFDDVSQFPSALELKNALHMDNYFDVEVIKRLFICYGKLLENKTQTVYVETGVSPERHRKAMLRAIRAENEVEALKCKIARMEQSDRSPHYNIEKGDKIAYKSAVTKEEIVILMNLGLSQTEIADKLNCSRSTIWRRLQE